MLEGTVSFGRHGGDGNYSVHFCKTDSVKHDEELISGPRYNIFLIYYLT